MENNNNNNRTTIKERPGIRAGYHNLPDKYGHNLVCVKSRNGDHIKLTYSPEWEPISAIVNHEGRITTTGAGRDPEYFEDLENQIAEGLKAADLVQAEKDAQKKAEKEALRLQRAREQAGENEQARQRVESGKNIKKSRGQCTLSESFAVQHNPKGATA